MIRLGFILGFLAGGGIAAFLAQSAESDSVEGGPAVNPVIGGVKSQVHDAREAALEAKLEKEAEMMRLHDDLVHGRIEPDPKSK